MESMRTSKVIIKEWFEANMKTHTDWTGTRVETKYKCDSIDAVVDKLYEYLKDNRYKESDINAFIGIVENVDDNRYWFNTNNELKNELLMIGDASGKEGQFSDSDKKCAENFGIDYIDVNDFINAKIT